MIDSGRSDFVAVSSVLGSIQPMEVVLTSKTKPLIQQISKHRAPQRGHSLKRTENKSPDVRTLAFKEAASPQSLAVAMSAEESTDQAFVDAISDW